jgi:hypothetical protein
MIFFYSLGVLVKIGFPLASTPVMTSSASGLKQKPLLADGLKRTELIILDEELDVRLDEELEVELSLSIKALNRVGRNILYKRRACFAD